MTLHSELERVTERVVRRSQDSRRAYLSLIDDQRDRGVHRPTLSCGNLAHGFAASGKENCGKFYLLRTISLGKSLK